MKKILLLFSLLLCVTKLHAANVQITKVTASITTSYSGISKDSIIKNNAKVTANLLPIPYFTFYFKWQGLTISPAQEQKVEFSIYSRQDGTKLHSMAYLLTSTSQNDSASITLLLGTILPNNPIGQSCDYEIKLSHKENAQTETVLAISNSWKCSFIEDPNKIYNNVICCSEVVTLPFTPTKPLNQDPSAGNGTQTTTHLPIKYV